MKKPIVILGSGGHAKVIIEILEECGEFDIRGCTSSSTSTGDVLGYPVLGTDEVLADLLRSGVEHAFVAIGDNRVRRGVSETVRKLGFKLANAISLSASVSRRASLGLGVAIMAGARINSSTEIGDGAIVNTGATVDHDCRIGECAHVAPGVHLAGNVRVGAGSFLGIGACAIPGVSIGEWAVVGAGAVVTRDIPAHSTAVGVPAVPKGRRHPLNDKQHDTP